MSKAVSVSNAIPDYLAGVNLPEFKLTDLQIPRMNICQAMTPQRKKADPSYVSGLEEGQFFNSVTGSNYTAEVDVTVLKVWPSRVKFYAKTSGASGLECHSPNGATGGLLSASCASCVHSQWEGRTPPACCDQENFLLWVDGAPVLFSAKMASLKDARRWKTQIAVGGVAYYGLRWKLATVPHSTTKGDFYGFRASSHGYVTAEEAVMYAELCDRFRSFGSGERMDHLADVEVPTAF